MSTLDGADSDAAGLAKEPQRASRSLPNKTHLPTRLASTPELRHKRSPPRIPLGLPSPVGNHECPLLGSCSTAMSQLRAGVIAIRERGQ